MGDLPFNRSKGRTVEYAERVNANDPANAAFIVGLWNITASDATEIDLDDLAAIEASGTNAELTSGTNANYVRKTLTDASGIVITYDDTNDRVDVDVPDQTWAALGAGTAVTDVIVGFDSDTTAGTDANIKPVSQHDFVVTPDGSDVVMQVAAAGFYRSQ